MKNQQQQDEGAALAGEGRLRCAPRRFTLLDLMILIAAIAVGFGMARLYEINYQAPSRYRFLDWLRGPPSCIAAALATALIGLRLRRPRPKSIRLLQQPGFLASIAVPFGASIGAIFASAHFVFRTILAGQQNDRLFNWFWHLAMLQIPIAVVGVWLTVILSNRWRPEASWIDRLGRAIGFYWVAYVLSDPLAPVIVRLLPFLP